MISFSIRRAIIFGYIVAMGIICFFALYTYSNMQKAEKENNTINKALQSLRAIEAIHDDVQNIENGERGFVISGKESFLEPYQGAISNISPDSARLAATASNPEREKEIEALLQLVHEKVLFAAAVVKLRVDSGQQAAERIIQSKEGKLLMDNIRGLVSKIEDEDRLILDEYNTNRERTARNTTTLFFILSGLFLLFLLSFLLLVRRDVHKRLNNELAFHLQEKTMSYKDILDRISDGFIALDKDWRYVYVNKEALGLIQKKQEEVIGKNIWDIFPEAKGTRFYQACLRAMEKQEYVFIETYYDRQNRWYESHLYPSSLGLTIHFRDITEKKKTEEELEKAGEQYKNLVNAVDGIVWEANAQTFNFTFVSDRAERLLGYPLHLWTTTPGFWADHIHPDDKNWAVRFCVQSTNEKQPHEFEYRMIAADGRVVWLRDIVNVTVENDKPVLLRGLMIDITAQKKAEEAILASEEKYRTLVEQATDGIFIADHAGKFVVVNSSGCALSQYSLAELMNMTIYDLADPEDLKTNPFHFEEMQKYGSATTERKMRKKDGTVIDIEVNAKFLSDGRFLSFIRDITERKKSQEVLEKYNDRFAMIAEVTHDAIWEWNLETGELWANNVHQKLYGLTKSDPVPTFQEWQSRIHPDDRVKTTAAQEVAVTTDINYWESEYRFLKGNKNYVNIYDRCYVIRNEEGKALRLTGSMTDISERIKAEEEKRASEEIRRLIMDSAMDAIICIDADSIITVWTRQAEKMFGWNREEAVGRSLNDTIIPHRYRRAHLEGLKLYQERGEGPLLRKLVEIPALNKAGEEFPVELSIVPVKQGDTEFFCAFLRNITERKKAEQDIQKSNERFKLIARTTNEAIWEWDFQANTGWANDAHQHLYGVGPADPVPGNDEWIKRIHPDDREKTITAFESVLASSESTWITEYRFLSGDKKPLTIYDRTYILRDHTGKPVRMMGSMMDISERKNAEQEIVRARELADKLIDSLPGIFYLYDKEGTFIRWNTQHEIVTGYSGEEIAKMKPTDFFIDEEKEYITGHINDVFEKGENDAEAHLLTKGGETIPYYFKAVLLSYQDKPCFLGYGIDISERKIAEMELRQSEEKYKLLFESNPLPMWMFSLPDYSIIDVNEAALRQYGYEKEHFLSLSALDLRPEEEVERFLTYQNTAYRLGTRNAGIWKHKRKDGSIIYVDILSHDVIYEGRAVRLILANDVTDKYIAEEKLKESYESIRQLTDHLQNIREEERAHIAREIHDELGQQLTVLKMDVSWLNKRMMDESEPIREKLKSLTEMLDGTVKTVRRISSELRPSLLDDLGLVATIDWHSKEFEKRSGIKTEFMEPEADFNLSESQKTGIFRIFQESLTNVARHSGADKVSISLQHTDDNLTLCIEDNGKGFDRQRVQNRRTLGILGMKERTAMMGGSYEIQSVAGKGTKVIVTVPLAGMY
jgi:PAS domain S-box-containing protein